MNFVNRFVNLEAFWTFAMSIVLVCEVAIKIVHLPKITIYLDDFVHLPFDFIQAEAVAFCFHTGARVVLGRTHISTCTYHKANVRNNQSGR